MSIKLTNQVLRHVSTFFKAVASDIDVHVSADAQEVVPVVKKQAPQIFVDKVDENKKQEDDILGSYLDEPYKKFVLSKTKIKDRKTTDNTKLTLDDYRWVKSQRKTALSHWEWQTFADKMNSTFSVNKSKNTWYNIVERKTAYLQTLDY